MKRFGNPSRNLFHLKLSRTARPGVSSAAQILCAIDHRIIDRQLILSLEAEGGRTDRIHITVLLYAVGQVSHGGVIEEQRLRGREV